MNLFIDTISKKSSLILFNQERLVKKQVEFEIKGNESSLLIPKIDNFLKQNKYTYNDIKNIVLVNGPGSFTGVRTVVLAVNTINYITKNNLTPINYFELYNNYPIIKTSSKRDCFVKLQKDSDIQIISNEEIEEYLSYNKIKIIYGDAMFEGVITNEKINYQSVLNNIKLENKKQIEPMYIKKPNIC